MIAELFLSSALAMPCSMVPHNGGRNYDIGVFQFIIKHYYKHKKSDTLDNGRIYMFGGPDNMLESFWRGAIKAFRITIYPDTPFDIVAMPDAIPLKKESAQAVIYLFSLKSNPWQSMKLWNEAAQLIPVGGFIAFYREHAKYFHGIAASRGWEQMPFKWYEMEIWKKKPWNIGGPKRTSREPEGIFGRAA